MEEGFALLPRPNSLDFIRMKFFQEVGMAAGEGCGQLFSFRSRVPGVEKIDLDK